MDVLKSWAVSVIAAAVVTAAVSYFSPSGKLDKSVKIITALFMLICLISPFVKSDINEKFFIDVEKVSEWLADNKLKKEVECEVESMLENSVCSRISAYLVNEGAEKSEVNVKVKIDENNNVKIQKIDIRLFEKIDENNLKTFVETEFETTPVISYALEE